MDEEMFASRSGMNLEQEAILKSVLFKGLEPISWVMENVGQALESISHGIQGLLENRREEEGSSYHSSTDGYHNPIANQPSSSHHGPGNRREGRRFDEDILNEGFNERGPQEDALENHMQRLWREYQDLEVGMWTIKVEAGLYIHRRVEAPSIKSDVKAHNPSNLEDAFKKAIAHEEKVNSQMRERVATIVKSNDFGVSSSSKPIGTSNMNKSQPVGEKGPFRPLEGKGRTILD
eukprot:Gb_21861 [translate_table: standard]